MRDKKKDGYLVAGVFVLAGAIFLYSSWWNFDLVFFMGVGLSALGIAGFKWPGVAEILLHWAKKQETSNQNRNSQTQKDTKNSIQAMAKRDVIIHNDFEKDIPEEKESDEKKELVKEINDDLTKEKLSNILIKCIRLAILTNSEKQKIWLENESQGFENISGEVKKETIPTYRSITAKIRIATKNSSNYETLDYPLGLIQPIFQIEGWIEEYEKKSGNGEMILTAPISSTLKKVYKNVLGKDIIQEKISSIIPIAELKKILNGLKLRISKFVNNVK